MPRQDDDDCEDSRQENYDDYQYEDSDDRHRHSRSRARDRAGLPAIFLMILGGIGVLYAITNAIVQASGINDGNNPFVNQQQQNDPVFKETLKIAKVVIPILNFIWALIVLTGGIQLKRMRTRGFVMFASIWAMLPCSECCLLGIPFGIWALVVTVNEDVKRSFS